MRSIRDIKRRARRDLHRAMQVPALLHTSTVDRNPVEISVRVHTRYDALGDQKGTNFNAAEREDVAPQIIFWREGLPALRRGYIVSVEPGEAYFIDTLLPPDDQTITAHVTVLNATQLAQLDMEVVDDG